MKEMIKKLYSDLKQISIFVFLITLSLFISIFVSISTHIKYNNLNNFIETTAFLTDIESFKYEDKQFPIIESDEKKIETGYNCIYTYEIDGVEKYFTVSYKTESQTKDKLTIYVKPNDYDTFFTKVSKESYIKMLIMPFLILFIIIVLLLLDIFRLKSYNLKIITFEKVENIFSGNHGSSYVCIYSSDNDKIRLTFTNRKDIKEKLIIYENKNKKFFLSAFQEYRKMQF